MKLLQYYDKDELRLGIETEKGVIDVAAEAAKCAVSAPKTVMEVIRSGEVAMRILDKLASNADRCIVPERLAPVVTGMEKILCIGRNYAAHAAELGNDVPTEPCVFSKFPNALAAHGDAVALPEGYTKYDYEAELVIIVGRELHNATETEAAAAIFGYTCGNDISNREAQFISGQWLIGKSSDHFGPIGPCLVTEDSFDPSDVAVRSYVNGELRQDGRTRDLIFPPAVLLSYISRHMTLRPGDIVFSGTPAGVIFGYPEERQVWLRAGDEVEIEVEGIGRLKNLLV